MKSTTKKNSRDNLYMVFTSIDNMVNFSCVHAENDSIAFGVVCGRLTAEYTNKPDAMLVVEMPPYMSHERVIREYKTIKGNKLAVEAILQDLGGCGFTTFKEFIEVWADMANYFDNLDSTEFDSSAIKAATYSNLDHSLQVVFTNGRSYIYEGVPRSVYDAFTSAESAGKYFNAAIRNTYVGNPLKKSA